MSKVVNIMVRIRNKYLKKPKDGAKKQGDMARLDYKMLMKDGLLPYVPHNEFTALRNTNINGFKSDYYG